MDRFFAVRQLSSRARGTHRTSRPDGWLVICMIAHVLGCCTMSRCQFAWGHVAGAFAHQQTEHVATMRRPLDLHHVHGVAGRLVDPIELRRTSLSYHGPRRCRTTRARRGAPWSVAGSARASTRRSSMTVTSSRPSGSTARDRPGPDTACASDALCALLSSRRELGLGLAVTTERSAIGVSGVCVDTLRFSLSLSLARALGPYRRIKTSTQPATK